MLNAVRPWTPWLLVCAVVAGTASAGMAVEPSSRPNIVFILADDLGYGDLGCYGQKQIRTPRIDQLAAGGTRFTQCYAGSTVCAPSRCTLMTGKHTGHARVRGNARVPLLEEDRTVAEVLRDAGYRTALIGKWGLGEPGTSGLPTKQGFEVFFGYLNQKHAHNYYPDYLWKNEEKYLLEGNVVANGVATSRQQYAPDLFLREALAFLDEPRRAGQPFFLCLTPTLPHANNEAGQKGMEIPSDAPYSDRDWPEPQRNHAAMITRLDSDVGRILDKLQERGLLQNTIVCFTSDNGPHKEGGGDPAFFTSSGPLRGIKRSMTDGGIRVPMIVSWPGKVPAQVSPQPWAFWDVLPTLAELAGAKTPAGIDGISQAPAWLGAKAAGREQPPHPDFYWEFAERGFVQAAVSGDGRWKAIRPGVNGPVRELYDLSADLHEDKNLVEEQTEVAARMQKFLDGARTDSAEFPVNPPKPDEPAKKSAGQKSAAKKADSKKAAP